MSLILFRSYNELDEIPAVVHPMLYEALADWDYDGTCTVFTPTGLILSPGFIMADDNGKSIQALLRHKLTPFQQ